MSLLLFLACTPAHDTAEAVLSPRTAVEVVPVDDARRVAERFVALNEHRSARWSAAQLDEPYTFYDHAGVPVMYEFPVLSDEGAPAGSIKLGARDGVGVVLSFFADGPSTAESLLDWAGDSAGSTLLADGPLFTAVQAADGRITGPSLIGLDAAALVDWPPSPMITAEAVDADIEVRDAWLEWSDEKLADLVGKPVSAVGDGPMVDIGSGAAEFQNWYQENRTWTSGTCNTGCAPLAMGMLYEYWDATYTGVVGSTSTNSWSSPTSKTIQEMLDDIREGMDTWCSGTAGLTYTHLIDNGGDAYTDSVGYSWSYNNDILNKWSNLMSEIDAGRPLLLSFTHTKGDHTALVYEYTDASGSSSDYVCIKTGWNISPYYECFVRGSYSWDRITRVKP